MHSIEAHMVQIGKMCLGVTVMVGLCAMTPLPSMAAAADKARLGTPTKKEVRVQTPSRGREPKSGAIPKLIDAQRFKAAQSSSRSQRVTDRVSEVKKKLADAVQRPSKKLEQGRDKASTPAKVPPQRPVAGTRPNMTIGPPQRKMTSSLGPSRPDKGEGGGASAGTSKAEPARPDTRTSAAEPPRGADSAAKTANRDTEDSARRGAPTSDRSGSIGRSAPAATTKSAETQPPLSSSSSAVAPARVAAITQQPAAKPPAPAILQPAPTPAGSTVMSLTGAGASGLQPGAPTVQMYDFRKSVVRMTEDGDAVKVVYERPRAGLDGVGITAGIVVFEGRKTGPGAFTGQSLAFDGKCNGVPFPVAGQLEGRKLTLRGQRPIHDAKCAIKSYVAETLVLEQQNVPGR
jgi:hypothetical protein